MTASSEEKSEFLARYQGLTHNTKLDNGSASEKADVLRNVVAHLQYANMTGLLDPCVIEHVEQQYEDMYTDLVDSFDEHTGLNNYAEGALALCKGRKNESENWTSSISLAKLKSLPYIQHSANRNKETVMLPAGKTADDLLPGCRPFNGANKENIAAALVKPDKNITLPTSHLSNLPPKQQTTLLITDNRGLQIETGTGHATNPPDRIMNMYGSPNVAPAMSTVANDAAGGYGFKAQSGAQPGGGRPTTTQGPARGYTDRQPLFSSGGKKTFDSWTGDRNKPSDVGNKRPYKQQADMDNEEDSRPACENIFKTAKQQMHIDNQRKYGGGAQSRAPVNTTAYGTGKKSLGTRRGLNSKFVPPVMNREDEDCGNEATNTITRAVLKTGGKVSSSTTAASSCNMEGLDEQTLKGIEPKMVELIMNEIMDSGPAMTWDDVAGLEFAKKTIKEIVVWPMLRPDIFTGLRGPPKGLLLFGPPGTGKTLIGKCIASQSKSTFFCISASSLTSKWVGEGEKMVRALFAVARARQPAVVFIDEIDSLLTQRSDGENEASRRIKTEFLVQLDGASTKSDDRLLVIGATNRPQEIDEAARRRFVKRLYIPLPEYGARKTIITNLLQQQAYQLTVDQLDDICARTEGFSGADMATLCREAALGPIRDMSFGDIENISADQVRPISYPDFEDALRNVKPSVSDKDLDVYIEWNKTFGSGSR